MTLAIQKYSHRAIAISRAAAAPPMTNQRLTWSPNREMSRSRPSAPMLSRSVPDVRDGASYEPKWDGFRSVIFRDGDEVEIGSRNERPMTRYSPELVEAFRTELPPRCVVDGEIVIARDAGLDFEALQLRLHPAASRVALLAERTPASFIAFDLLAIGDEDLTEQPFERRRARLVEALRDVRPPVHLTPAT